MSQAGLLVTGPLSGAGGNAQTERPGHRGLPLSLLGVAAVVVATQPFMAVHLPGQPSFIPAMLAVVFCLDMLSAVLLLRQFRDAGDRRALVLASAYVYCLAVLVGYSAAFPGVLGVDAPLGSWPSTAPWLWLAWHGVFPVLLAAAVAPWPRRWADLVAPSARGRPSWVAVLVASGSGTLIVVGAVAGQGWLPVVINGSDASALTWLVAPVVLPVVGFAVMVAIIGALRLSGPVRWAALASAAAGGDLVLGLFSLSRFTVGWYVGRTLTVVSAAVVVVAILGEFGRLRSQLATEAGRLALVLGRTEELERVHSTLLDHMSDGVMLHDAEGRVVAANRAVETLLGVSGDDLRDHAFLHAGWTFLGPDGAPLTMTQLPVMRTLVTGEPQRNRMFGVQSPNGERRWLRISTSVQEDESGRVRYVASSMSDATETYEAELAKTRDQDEKSHRVRAVLDSGGPQIVVQPIVDLSTGQVVGAEALSRFSGSPAQPPDVWFADAFEVGLGADLELLTIRLALGMLGDLPDNVYLSINTSPATATSSALFDMLKDLDTTARRIVVEITEHAVVTDYPMLTNALSALRTLGVRIAVDDAGSGFASLSHILALRPDIVKLDLALVRGIHADPARRSLAAGLLVFAEQIGALIVAEGVETEQEFATLRELGITHGQGYHLGRPAPLPMPATVSLPTIGRKVLAPSRVGQTWPG